MKNTRICKWILKYAEADVIFFEQGDNHNVQLTTTHISMF